MSVCLSVTLMVIRGNCSSVIETHMQSATEKEKTKHSIMVQINAKMNDHILQMSQQYFICFPIDIVTYHYL